MHPHEPAPVGTHPRTPNGPIRCVQQVGPSFDGRSVELAGTHSGSERGPLRRGELQGRPGGVLGVPHGAMPSGSNPLYLNRLRAALRSVRHQVPG
jgi:hypothetical protein